MASSLIKPGNEEGIVVTAITSVGDFSGLGEFDNLSVNKLKEITYIYLCSVISLLGIFTNLVCVVVFRKMKRIHKTYTLLMVVSLVDCFYLALGCAIFVARVDHISVSGSYGAALFDWFSEHFLTSTFALYNILIEWAISLRRYLSLCNSKLALYLKNRYIITGAYLIALLVYSPILFAYKIDSVDNYSNRSWYSLERTEFGQSTLFAVITIGLSLIRGVGTILFMLTLNFLTQRKHHQLNRQQASPQANVGTDLTRMVLSMCCLVIIGCTPYSIYTILVFFVDPLGYPMQVYAAITLTVLMLYHSVRLFVYYVFNTQFRRQLNIKRLCRLFRSSNVAAKREEEDPNTAFT
nr:G protein-coupled receptor [Proales similis]